MTDGISTGRGSRGPEHQRCLELAAAAIDFQLSPAEERLLRTHLAICAPCTAIAGGMRADASILAATPSPAAPGRVRDAVVGATVRHDDRRGWTRWSVVVAAMLLTVIVGAVAAGALVDRARRTVPAPTAPVAIVRPTPAPAASEVAAPRGGWHDVGDLGGVFGERMVRGVLAAPDGGVVALGIDPTTADPVVWVSPDGADWTLVAQPAGVFGGNVPTSGALAGPGMLVVGWDVSVEAGQQRAIWESADGRSWRRSTDRSALLGTQESDLTMTAGPAGVIVWTPSGKVWTSRDGMTWTGGSIGQGTITDVAVDADRFIAVGLSGGDAFLTTSTDGQAWTAVRDTPAIEGSQVGIERAADGVEAVWVGAQRWERSGADWHAVDGASVPRVPDGTSIMGGAHGLVALGAPTGGDAYRAWTWDGTGDWVTQRVDAEPGSGPPTIVAAAPEGGGWFVLTRRDGALHGWSVTP